MADLLAQASVLAEASAAGISERTSHGKSGTREPTIGGPSTFDRIHKRFEGCRSDRERTEAIAWAKDVIRLHRGHTPRELTVRQRDYWILVDSQGRDYRDVAAEFQLKETTVWRMRSDNGYEPRKGRPKAA